MTTLHRSRSIEDRRSNGPEGEYSGRDTVKVLFVHETEDITLAFDAKKKTAMLCAQGAEKIGWCRLFDLVI